ncbi:hypothetical protein PRZ48_012061 [Zasmidium cellare]|uniref:Transcription initiation factor TFIID subunit 13 n=1 Tax=Zasmidium cellare TaxID=395010 RepID=A0ABR0E3T3_ZASCE|nr:hypothetical protein PRZ48_012061 [Zasmidium cellare]
MAEPRARPRTKGQVFADQDLRELLFSFGDPQNSLPTTLTVLDEILTDFIIETCHAAATCASYSRRQKIKMDDFRFVLRRNGAMLGRVAEQMARERWIKNQRKMVDFEEIGREGVTELAGIAEAGGAENELKKKGRGRGGRKKRKAEDEGEGSKVKRVAT